MEVELQDTKQFVGVDVSTVLFEDLSIDLEKLAYVVTELVKALEAEADEHDVTVNLYGLDKYFELRNVPPEDEAQKREEKAFLLSFASAIAMEASERDTIVVKFTQEDYEPNY